MSRPSRVYPKNNVEFKHLHTRKVKMYCGVELTALHLIKETAQYFISLDSWAFCCGKFKGKKKHTKLAVDIPVLTDEATIKFLSDESWHDWVARELADMDTDMFESIELLTRLFPNKKYVFFYELKSIIAQYCHGGFLSYDKDGKVEPVSDHALKSRKYYTSKYLKYQGHENAYVKGLYDVYQASKKDGKEKDAAFTKYHDANLDYLYKNYDLTDTFLKMGQHVMVCPYAFTNPTVKGMSYENAGEFYMIVTPDTVYFEVERHF